MRNSDRQYIPTMPAKPAPSLWQRVRSAASTAVAAVRSVGARVGAFVARKATGARATLSRVARAVMTRRPWVLTRQGADHAATRVTVWCRDTWHRVVRPFMRVRVTALGIGAAVIGLVAAPITTLTIMAGAGAALLGLSRLISVLEDSDRPAAHVALVVIEYAAQALRAVAYVVAGGVVIALSAVSMPFAVTEIAELVMRYLDVPHATSFAALAFFVMTASWGLAVIEVAWLAFVHDFASPIRVTKSRAGQRQVIPLIRIDADRAWNGDKCTECGVNDASFESLGAHGSSRFSMCRDCVEASKEPMATEEEMQELVDVIDARAVDVARNAKCEGCDLDDRSPRFRIGNMSSLCGDCFKCLVDDELITAADRGEVSAEDVLAAARAGIQVPAYVIIATGARLRSTRIDLDREAITCRTEARILSEQDTSKIHWAETGWWFDARGSRRARRWHGFIAGRVAAIVEYEYQKDSRGFYAFIDGAWLAQAYKTLRGAQDAAVDEIGDRAYVAAFDTQPPARVQIAGAVS